MDSNKFCVYNKTQASFLCVGVSVVDPSLESLDQLSGTLYLNAESGLWLAAAKVRPAARTFQTFDLICLDEEDRVVQSVEFNPAADELAPVSAKAASALVLAPRTISLSRTCSGDQLIICDAEEMVRYLARTSMFTTPAAAKPEPIAPAPTAPASTNPAPVAPAPVVPPPASPAPTPSVPAVPHMEPRAQKAEAEATFVPALTVEDFTPEKGLIQSPEEVLEPETEPTKWDSWAARLLRWVANQPPPARRLPYPGLVAYYWTGGAPQSYHVGNISASGVYLITKERWTPGTLIMMTLQRTDDQGKDIEDAIAVMSQVVRWGPDGVGLHFIPPETAHQGSGEILSGRGADKKALDQFLHRVKTTAGRA